MHGVRRIADALVATFDPDGMTLYQNNGVVSRQEVPHFHMHVVPRRKDSNWGKGPPQIAVLENRDESIVRRVKISAERELELAEQIRSNL
jgi:diadenosine tetraphosphate (Ap4A) HIT family hydrolase